MQFLIRRHDQFLLRDLGLGPKRLAKVKVKKSDRPWHMDSYKVPAPFEKPPKKKRGKSGPQPAIPAGNPSPPARQDYWNRYSHFHR
jgi:hypothetical protein